MDVSVETIATCKKRLSITIPREEIDAKFDERFSELEREAFVPGFRPGHAPRRLIEKRFREAVAEEIRAKLVAEALEKALQEQNLDVVGEPNLDPEKVELPDEGPMTFTVDLEVRPEFDLPEGYSRIPLDGVERPQVTDETVAQALERLREQHGRLETLPEDEPAGERDLVVADLTIQAGDVMVVDRQNVRLPLREVAIEGIRLDVLPDLLKGVKAGETRTAQITIGAEADNEEVRGREADLTVKVARIERLRLPDDAELLAAAGYEDMEALRAAIRRQQESRSEAQFRDAQEEAVRRWLLEHCQFDLPEDLVRRHANRLLQRRLMSLQYRGVPAEEIERHMEDLSGASSEQAARDLRLYFIIDAIAKKENLEVTDAEVNARIQFMAVQYGRRPDRLREEMAASGGLDALRTQILEDKVIRTLVDRATGAAPAPDAEGQEPAEAEKAETSAPAETAEATEGTAPETEETATDGPSDAADEAAPDAPAGADDAPLDAT